jgi:hypothetical protein
MRNEDIVWVKKGHVQLTMKHEDVLALCNLINEQNTLAPMTANEFDLYQRIVKMADTIRKRK